MYHYKAELVRIVDGGTLDLSIDLGMGIYHRARVRLAGINTPETYGVKRDSEEYAAGMRATKHVEKSFALADSFTIKTQKDKKGKYGRYIAEIWLSMNGKEWSLNESLVEQGYAQKVNY